jgi:prepilin-type N-terminal cleavage/methylation domain-containing protein
MRSSEGFTIVEMLVVLSLLSVVLGAVVSAYSAFLANQRSSDQQTDAQERARLAMGTLAQQLRNLAGPADFAPEAVEVAEPFDLVFKSVDSQPKPAGSLNARNIMRIRYCLAPAVGGQSKLVRQEQKWTTAAQPARPAGTGCGAAGWDSTTTVADSIVNLPQGTVPVFSYTPPGVATTDIKAIKFELLVDTDVRDERRQARVASGVFLRNQNRRPIADFTATYTGQGRQVVLNASASEDPEGHALLTDGFGWTVNGTPLTGGNQKGIVVYWTAPAAGTYNVGLTVKDHASLSSLPIPTKPVTVP